MFIGSVKVAVCLINLTYSNAYLRFLFRIYLKIKVFNSAFRNVALHLPLLTGNFFSSLFFINVAIEI